MSSRRAFAAFAALAFGAALAAVPACVVAASPSELSLQEDLQRARWPADIVRAADRYVAAFPQGAAAAAARSLTERAQRSARALDRNVRLFRGDFQLGGVPAALDELVRKAALADSEAALRVAHVIRDGEDGVDFDVNRYVGWLQFASALGSAPASYELALHYRKADQPALAAPYELRAAELGFLAPRALDNVRK